MRGSAQGNIGEGGGGVECHLWRLPPPTGGGLLPPGEGGVFAEGGGAGGGARAAGGAVGGRALFTLGGRATLDTCQQQQNKVKMWPHFLHLKKKNVQHFF